MEEVKFEFTPEQTEHLLEQIRQINEAAQKIADIMIEICDAFIEAVRKFAETVGRFFLKQQLLEWRIPARVADIVSEKIYWMWAFNIGLRWFNNKLLAIE